MKKTELSKKLDFLYKGIDDTTTEWGNRKIEVKVKVIEGIWQALQEAQSELEDLGMCKYCGSYSETTCHCWNDE